ncbi:hypothetical protein NQZ79_g3092 [Umbelopsis isabellina]|nr:hypothetical protein NQZ79_g3092 [Umbelopsis isabellina]
MVTVALIISSVPVIKTLLVTPLPAMQIAALSKLAGITAGTSIFSIKVAMEAPQENFRALTKQSEKLLSLVVFLSHMRFVKAATESISKLLFEA